MTLFELIMYDIDGMRQCEGVFNRVGRIWIFQSILCFHSYTTIIHPSVYYTSKGACLMCLSYKAPESRVFPISSNSGTGSIFVLEAIPKFSLHSFHAVQTMKTESLHVEKSISSTLVQTFNRRCTTNNHRNRARNRGLPYIRALCVTMALPTPALDPAFTLLSAVHWGVADKTR